MIRELVGADIKVARLSPRDRMLANGYVTFGVLFTGPVSKLGVRVRVTTVTAVKAAIKEWGVILGGPFPFAFMFGDVTVGGRGVVTINARDTAWVAIADGSLWGCKSLPLGEFL